MGLLEGITLIWIFIALVDSTKHRLYCQTPSIAPPPMARLQSSVSARPDPSVLTPIARDERVKFELNACCGPKAFSTAMSVCCMGKTVKRTTRRCCVSGSTVLRAAKCTCYPQSTWVKRHIARLTNLRNKAITLLEDGQNARDQLLEIVAQKEASVRELDAKASALYQSFLKEIGLERTEDPEEVQYIYNLVTFLHSNEEGNLEKTVSEEGTSESSRGQRLNDAISGIASKEQKAKEDLLILLRILLRRAKSRLIDIPYLIEIMKIAGGDSSIESVLWKSIHKKQDLGLTDSLFLDRSGPEEGDLNIESIVIQRNDVLKQIRTENDFIITSGNRLEELEKLLQVAKSEEKLVAQLMEILDETLEEALENEDELRALEREVEESEGGSFDSIKLPPNVQKPPSRTGASVNQLSPGCNVTNWITFVRSIVSEVQEGVNKLEEILLFIPATANNRVGNDPVPQWTPRFSPEDNT